MPSAHPRIRPIGRAVLAFSIGFLAASAAATAVPGAGAIAAPAAALDSLVRAETRVRWEPGPPDSSLARAARDSMPAFLDFYADWCAPCRWMDRAVYSDPLLAEACEGVAMIRVDIETPAGKALASRYGIQQYPTLVFILGDGKEKLRWPGPLSLRDTRLDLAQSAYPKAQRAAVEERVKSAPDDPTIQAAAILWYGMRGEVENARRLAAALEKRGTKLAPAERAQLQLALAKSEEMAGRGDRALLAYRGVLAAEPNGAFAWRAWLGVSVALERAGDVPAAIIAAHKAHALGPDAPFLDARVERLALDAPPLATPPGVDDGPEAR